MINPKQLAATSLNLLEEAVLAILFIEQSYLTPEEISNRLGIKSEDYRAIGYNHPILRSLLRKLEREGRVEPDSRKNAKWRLTESEIKARVSTSVETT